MVGGGWWVVCNHSDKSRSESHIRRYTLIRADQPFPESTDGTRKEKSTRQGENLLKRTLTYLWLPSRSSERITELDTLHQIQEKVFASVIKNENHQKSSSHHSYTYTSPKANFLGEINCHRCRIGSMEDGFVLPFPYNKMLVWVKEKLPKWILMANLKDVWENVIKSQSEFPRAKWCPVKLINHHWEVWHFASGKVLLGTIREMFVEKSIVFFKARSILNLNLVIII